MAQAGGAGQAIQLVAEMEQRLQLLLARRLVRYSRPAIYGAVQQAWRVGAWPEERHLMAEFSVEACTSSRVATASATATGKRRAMVLEIRANCWLRRS